MNYRDEEMDRFRVRFGAALESHRPDDIERALQTALELQIRLFPCPPAEFLALAPAAQFERLGRGQSPDEARASCELYAELLFYTATLYDLQDRVELAAGARQLALHLALLTVLRHGSEDAAQLVEPLRQLLPDGQVNDATRDLLAAFDRAQH